MVFDRRAFMKFAAGASAGIMVTPLPWKLLDDISIWTQNWPWIPRNQPGENTFAHAVSKTCPSGVPMRIRLVEGRPVRVLPVDNHPLGGGVTSLAVAEVQMLQSPARVRRPLRRGPDGGFTPVEWEEALALLQDKISPARNKAAFVSGDETGSINEVLSALAASLGSDKVFLMPSEGQCAAKAAELMGLNAQIGYDLERSDYVLSIGANLLESWGTVVRNRRVFRNSHPHPVKSAEGAEGAATVTFAYAGSVQNNTAAVASPWLPIYPGTEGALALGIANLLIAKGRMLDAADFGAFKSLAARFTLEETAKITGASPAKLEEVVAALLAAKAPLVIVGSEFNQGSGAAPIMAGFAVNALLGNINKPGGVTLLPPTQTVLPKAVTREALYKRDLVSWLLEGEKPEVLVLHEANPVYALPNPAAIKEALQAIPFKVSFSTFMDETAALCDLVLPVSMGLERVDDLETPYGSGQVLYCITTIAAPPQENVYFTANVLFHLAEKMGMKLGADSYEDMLKEKALRFEKCSFDILAAGQAAVLDDRVDLSAYQLQPGILGKALADSLAPGGKLRLAPYAKLNRGTAKTGIPPHNVVTLRVTEMDGSTMSVMMNGKTASKNGLANGDMVSLASGRGAMIKARLRVFEGVMNDTVAVSLGFGRTALDKFSQNKGANVMELMNATPEGETGLMVWAKSGVTVAKA